MVVVGVARGHQSRGFTTGTSTRSQCRTNAPIGSPILGWRTILIELSLEQQIA
jgi:hypothetical protein